ncbi:Plasminogen activator inhibitor 1 [Camponotus floridanus]|uniref:Plasminogen activator inhibitor 1 n=1 Tax=Camponotus floridanus TaxID=104421 RepID=E2AL14_CAMFO|nr:Plasminogen activator inhibitor 1 [Camponotus floridanus]
MRSKLEYLLCFSIMLIFIKKCVCVVTPNPVETNISSQITPQTEDDEDFVPYHGERFSVFDWMLFRNLAKTNAGNILLSPISIKLALVLLYEGAQDQTARELAEVMQLPLSVLATREKFNNILKSLQAPSSAYTLNIGSRIYIDNNVLTRQRYAATVKTFYNTDVINANLSDTHTIATKVNSWISNVTNGHIEKMIDNEETLENSVMLIANGLFFKGAWRRKYFAPENTRVSKFYINANESVDVQYMHTISRFYYAESSRLGAKILRIPYDGSKFAIYIILPHMSTVDHVIKQINPFVLSSDLWAMQELPLNVWIPKFKFEFTSHLENTLRELGIRDIFDNTALLTGIAKTKRASKHLQVSDVMHKTGIEVNENGTIAYAATEIQIGNKIEEGTFYANQPFVFYIEDETTGTILYVGLVRNPLNETGTTGKIQQELPSRFNLNATTVTPSPAATGTEDRYGFFNIDLLQRVNEDNEGNLILSPASAKVALTSLVEGTGGQTRQELLAALRLPPDEFTIRRITRRTLMSLKSYQNGTEIDVATRLWINPMIRTSPGYTSALYNNYGTDIQQLNFGDANVAANRINAWVRENTKNNIKSIIQPGTVSADTQILLTSVLYFKGQWMKSFDKDATRTRCFRVPVLGCKDVPMMESTSQYRYAYVASLDADVVEIPYSNGRTSMLIFLPFHEESDPYLQILSKDLSYVTMRTLLSSLNETELVLSIPRFNIESKLNLASPLMRMGVLDIFGTRANFTGFIHNDYLRIGNIIQNAKIEVNEEGTIAVAATELTIVPLMGNTAIFIANRPFIFAIVDLNTTETLFAGRVMDPSMSNSGNF